MNMNKKQTIDRRKKRKIKEEIKKQRFELELIKREIYRYYQQLNFNKHQIWNTTGYIPTTNNTEIKERKPEINNIGGATRWKKEIQ